MARGSRSSLRRRERRTVIETKTAGLSALDMADALRSRQSASDAPAQSHSGALAGVALNQDTPVRCPECGWAGQAIDLGAEGECGSGEECQGRPTAIVGKADMIQAWADTDGMVCGPQLVALGLLEPLPGTEDEAREEWGVDTLWDLTAEGEAILRDAREQDALLAEFNALKEDAQSGQTEGDRP